MIYAFAILVSKKTFILKLTDDECEDEEDETTTEASLLHLQKLVGTTTNMVVSLVNSTKI